MGNCRKCVFLTYALVWGYAVAFAQIEFRRDSGIDKHCSASPVETSRTISLFGDHQQERFHFRAVGAGDQFFHKVFLVDSQGRTVSDGFAPSAMFYSSHNIVVFSGLNEHFRDSFNPYGSVNIQQALLTGTLNAIFTGLRKSRQ
jgi:hypothetical protein